jgi:succinate dehydrogenase/fumarate reductase flavoprotein subunit
MEQATVNTDLLIIGAGFAGCRAAIEAHDLGANVLLVTQGHFVATGSSFHPIRLTWGRGYTAGLGINGEADTPQAHLEDILRAGQGLTDEYLARVLVEDAPARYRDLEKFGVEFTLMSRLMKLDVNDHGRGTRGALAMNPENLRATFRNQIESRNIQVREQTQVVVLLGEPGHCAGAILVDNAGAITIVHARATILASGGPNDLFLHNLNTPDLTGACHVFALDLGARLVNMEFFQIILGMTQHPHATFAEAFLGLHPKIRNSDGDELFADAPDILDARAKTGPFTWNNPAAQFDLALQNELRAGRTVSVDFSDCGSLEVSQTIANKWRVWAETNGVNFSQPIEIVPCAHACNGGIWIDADGATGVANLFACGEVTGGMHGANRIGGNQFASAQVFGVRAARAAVRCGRESTSRELNRGQIAEHVTRIEQLHARGDQGVPAMELRRRLQETMWRDAMLDRTEASLQNAQTKLREIESRLSRVAFHSPGEFAIALGLPGMIRIAQIILRVALQRNESRGPHYRADFAFQDEEKFRQPIVVSQNESWTRMNADKRG